MAPVTRTRSKKMNGKKIALMECRVCLKRLTEAQIMRAVASDLTEIKNNRSDHTPKYNLRSGRENKRRECKVTKTTITTQTKATAKKSNTSTAIAKIMPTNMTVTRLWSFLKNEFKVKPFENLCCLAKMKTYSPWPAMVTDCMGKKTKVYFFGDGTIGTVDTNEIVPFKNCSVLVKKYLDTKGYSRAVRELEISLNIPLMSSITK